MIKGEKLTLHASPRYIAIPIISIFVQSLFVEHQKPLIEIETCDPFGCTKEVGVDIEAFAILNKENPLGRFNGFATYTDRNHLAVEELSEGWKKSKTLMEFSKIFYNSFAESSFATSAIHLQPINFSG